jgi:large-conductance mechanosensitive channel
LVCPSLETNQIALAVAVVIAIAFEKKEA